MNLNIYYFIDEFKKNEIEKLSTKISLIYRNYDKKKDFNEIKKLVLYCKNNRRKVYISNNLKAAIKYNFDGLYIPSFNKSLRHNVYKTKKKFHLIGSAHNVNELNIKIKQNVEELFIAPVFKKKINILGLFGFLKLRLFFKKKLIALGGINQNNIRKLEILGADGFAAINYFEKKKAPKKGP